MFDATHLHSYRVSFPPLDNSTSKGTPNQLRLSLGEILKAVVVEKFSDNKVMLMLKNHLVLADSNVSLNASESLLVRVNQLYPKIVLRIAKNEALEAPGTDRYLAVYRYGPDALAGLITTAGEIFGPENSGWLSHYISGRDIDDVLKLINSLIFSEVTTKNPFYLKEFISNLGLLLENELVKVLKRSSGKEISKSLKGLLMKISRDLRGLLEGGEVIDRKAVNRLNRLALFLDKSVDTIETQQVINVLSQERENGYILQIPFLFPDGIRTGVVYFDLGRGRRGESKGQWRIVFFLNMDALGDLMIEAGITGRKVSCLLKCEDDKIRDFISTRVEKLKGNLHSLGYELDYFTCVTEKDLSQGKNEFMKERVFHGEEMVDLFA